MCDLKCGAENQQESATKNKAYPPRMPHVISGLLIAHYSNYSPAAAAGVATSPA